MKECRNFGVSLFYPIQNKREEANILALADALGAVTVCRDEVRCTTHKCNGVVDFSKDGEVTYCLVCDNYDFTIRREREQKELEALQAEFDQVFEGKFKPVTVNVEVLRKKQLMVIKDLREFEQGESIVYQTPSNRKEAVFIRHVDDIHKGNHVSGKVVIRILGNKGETRTYLSNIRKHERRD